MAKQIQLRRGTTAENNAFTGALGELTYDTEKKQLRVHDGNTVGGKVVDDTTRDVTSQVSNATETIAGKAKIATTAIAQEGVNDTDFLTAKKLRDALNAEGIAPVYTSRAIAQGNSSAASPVLTRKLNISTASKINNQVLSFTFTTAMPDNNYTVLGIGSDQAIGVEGFSGSLIGFDQTTTGFKVKYSFATQASSQAINSFRLVVL